MKTYLLNYKKPNTHTYYDLIKHPDQIAAEERMAKEPDPEKRKTMIPRDEQKRFISLAKDFTFYPGINEVPENVYELLKDNKNFLFFLDTRPVVMEWVRGYGPEDKDQKPFASLRDRDALDIVEAMWSKPMIEKYLQIEKRNVVKKALEDQLEKLKIKPKKVA